MVLVTVLNQCMVLQNVERPQGGSRDTLTPECKVDVKRDEKPKHAIRDVLVGRRGVSARSRLCYKDNTLLNVAFLVKVIPSFVLS